MPTKYINRTSTQRIVVHRRRNSEDMDTNKVEVMHRRLGHHAIACHFVVRHNGDIEDGRDVLAQGGYFPTTVDILLLCEGDEPIEQQTQSVNDLVAALQLDFPGADVVHT